MTSLINKNKIYTVEEFVNLPDDNKRYELIDGKLKEQTGFTCDHGRLSTDLLYELIKFLEGPNSVLGEALTNCAFELNSKTVVQPDAAFISAKRLAGIDSSKPFPGGPDLVIEVISSDDIWSELISKIRLYQSYGVTLVWLVDPFDQSVFVYRPNQNAQLLSILDVLSGEDVLPGFTLPVKDLFP
ncbi:MAG: Uma2 family endonuclease [Chloroflexi bacterium]|nr:Uma2 family endonuclease [Chloroflexota bacterium]OJW06512.1 MAG: hypothetical protein BGO39_00420 [Chloroflexi bacterium 54-19]